MKLINEAEVLNKWRPIVEEATGLSSTENRDRVDWISKYCHFHDVNESAATLGNVSGMGNVRLPIHGPGATSTQDGSGDRPTNTLAMSMQVAAQTIGFDLVPAVPMDAAFTILTYTDVVYADGRIDTEDTPAIVTIDLPLAGLNAGDVVAVANATEADLDNFEFVFLGNSRIEGTPILQVQTAPDGYSLADLAADGTATLGGELFDGATFRLVNALENHVTGFSGSNFTTNDPYTRGEGERTPNRTMGLSLYSKTVEAETFQVDAALKWEQLQDIPRDHGWDPVAQLESALINELSQSINKYILARLFTLGALNVANTNTGLETLTLTDDPNLVARDRGHEERRIMSRGLAVSNFIANRGRRGPATFIVTNARVGTILQNISGFTQYPMVNTVSQNSGSLYPVGTFSNLTVYIDPNMEWGDDRMLIGRKGDGNSPGVVFMPYIMADSVNIIAEGTMAPKIAMKSRFALVDAGHYPEIYYFVVDVENAEIYV